MYRIPLKKKKGETTGIKLASLLLLLNIEKNTARAMVLSSSNTSLILKEMGSKNSAQKASNPASIMSAFLKGKRKKAAIKVKKLSDNGLKRNGSNK
jgi:hypothetical protein